PEEREVAERNWTEARRERSEALAIIRLGRKRDDARGATVEITIGDDDFRSVAGNALDAVGPAARRLDCSLNRFGAGVHRQRDVEARELAQLLEKRAEAVVVVSARRHGEAVGLRGEGGEDTRMRVAVARRRIGAHHVDVAPPRRGPPKRRLAPRPPPGERALSFPPVSRPQLGRPL